MDVQLRKSITTLIFVLCAALAGGVWAQAPKSPMAIKPDAPDRYVVVPGDTLWSIAERYTDSPWRWPELWDLNKDQIRDPHRIYPGNIVLLDRMRGQLALADTVKLSPRVRAESTAREAVPSIPPQIIEPFLTRPLIVEADGLDKAPSIVAADDGRVVLAAGNRAYVRGLGDAKAGAWYAYRRGGPLVDPESNQTLGYEAVYLGTARVVRAGEPATIEITSVAQDVGIGDRLVPAPAPVPVNYAPRSPQKPILGRVMTIYGSAGRVAETAQNAIITINRGKADGLEVGHVLALHRFGGAVARAAGPGAAGADLPNERYGLAFVFRVFDRVSYALVMRVTRTVSPQDVVQNP
jgi:hypothetical protein